MNRENFQEAIQSIATLTFEDSKLNAAKNCINSNELTSAQVKEIMALFNFDDSKIEFAEYAFSMVSDKENYHLVKEIFESDKSKDKLSSFLKESHGWYD